MRQLLTSIVCLLLQGCTGEVDLFTAVGEPVHVPFGSFHEGELEEAPKDETPLRVTSVESASGILLRGHMHHTLTGRVSNDAWAIGLRFGGLGSGWWVLPVEDIDPLFPAARSFLVAYDIGATIEPGTQRLELAAIDAFGRRGPTFGLSVCVVDDLLVGDLSACDPTLRPPSTAIVLTWNRNVDLDLHVRTPEGKRVGWRHPTTASDSSEAQDATVGRMTRDSNSGCVIDARNSEALVWLEPPEQGRYSVFVDLFDPCGQSGTLYTVSVLRRREHADGTYSVEQTEQQSGGFIADQASGGAKPPIYVMDVQVP